MQRHGAARPRYRSPGRVSLAHDCSWDRTSASALAALSARCFESANSTTSARTNCIRQSAAQPGPNWRSRWHSGRTSIMTTVVVQRQGVSASAARQPSRDALGAHGRRLPLIVGRAHRRQAARLVLSNAPGLLFRPAPRWRFSRLRRRQQRDLPLRRRARTQLLFLRCEQHAGASPRARRPKPRLRCSAAPRRCSSAASATSGARISSTPGLWPSVVFQVLDALICHARSVAA